MNWNNFEIGKHQRKHYDASMSAQALPHRNHGFRAIMRGSMPVKTSQNKSLEAVPLGGHSPVHILRFGPRAVTPPAITSPHSSRSRARTRSPAFPIFPSRAPGAASA